jgi:prepilin-type N-terminal cleavage/methylation domain-containing protein
MQLSSKLRQRRQRGLSLVELMVGITVGLIVAAGASMVAVNQINEHRRLMLEVQVQQDLRAAADLIQQDIRRAGYRGLPQFSVWQPASGVGTAAEVPAQAASANPYASVVRTDNSAELTLTYSYARDLYNTNDVPLANEKFGIRWDKNAQVLRLQLGLTNNQPNWQPITDPASVKIVDFQMNIASQAAPLGEFCDPVCTGATCPQQIVQRVTYTIRGQATHDPNVNRTLTGVERIRADTMTGACP